MKKFKGYNLMERSIFRKFLKTLNFIKKTLTLSAFTLYAKAFPVRNYIKFYKTANKAIIRCHSK